MGEGPNLNVPRGFEVRPRNVSTSPFVSIPLTPVPVILSAWVMLFSSRSLCTDGKRGRECSGGASECASADWGGAGSDVKRPLGLGVGGGVDELTSACLGGGGAASSLGISRLDMSSPSSARRAMVLPMGTPLVPSGA